MHERILISKTGHNKLKEEIREIEKDRVDIRARVAEAREEGDLKESSQYIYGRQQLGFTEGRLAELRAKVNWSEVVDCTTVQTDRAVFGTVVTLIDTNTQEKVTYQLLGPHDANFDSGSISILSPIGDALLGLSVGDKTTVTIPRGEFHFEVIDIGRSDIK